jgi:transcriptional regulator with XRE-family HTH domain
MPAKKRSTGLVQQLKDAIEESGLSLGELGRRSGVATSQLSHFVRGERTITLPVAEKLCEALGYHLERDRPRRRRKANPEKPKRS